MLRCKNILCVKGPTTVFVPQGPQMFVCFKNPFQTHQWTGYTHTHTHGSQCVFFTTLYDHGGREGCEENVTTNVNVLVFKFELKAFMQLMTLWLLDQDIHFFSFISICLIPSLEMLGMCWLSLHLSDWQNSIGCREPFLFQPSLMLVCPK